MNHQPHIGISCSQQPKVVEWYKSFATKPRRRVVRDENNPHVFSSYNSRDIGGCTCFSWEKSRIALSAVLFGQQLDQNVAFEIICQNKGISTDAEMFYRSLRLIIVQCIGGVGIHA